MTFPLNKVTIAISSDAVTAYSGTQGLYFGEKIEARIGKQLHLGLLTSDP